MRLYLIIILFSTCVSIEGQISNCLRELAVSSQIFKKIPRMVDLCQYADSMKAFKVVPDIDLNLDGITDTVVFLRKEKNNEGTNQYVLLCLSNNKSRGFDIIEKTDLLPMFFSSYSLEYIVGLPIDKQEKYIYNDGYPLNMLKFENGSITISVKVAALDEFVFRYIFNKEKNNFVFENCIYYFDGLINNRNLMPKDFNFQSDGLEYFVLENVFVYF